MMISYGVSWFIQHYINGILTRFDKDLNIIFEEDDVPAKDEIAENARRYLVFSPGSVLSVFTATPLTNGTSDTSTQTTPPATLNTLKNVQASNSKGKGTGKELVASASSPNPPKKLPLSTPPPTIPPPPNRTLAVVYHAALNELQAWSYTPLDRRGQQGGPNSGHVAARR
ncbi:hypothetical protein BGX38DRAFT_1144513 [Terfezia claveryi]|nr:hypothetical protein BGX38DRAFT_1144513 [Terfezia claveryi]